MQHWLRKKYEWMRQNKKWLFSGIVPSFIVLLILILWSTWTQDSDSQGGPEWPKAVNGQASRPIRLVDTLTAEGAMEAVRDALPLQRKTVAQSYVGIKVSWRSDLRDMHRRSETILGYDKDTNRVDIILHAGFMSSIRFQVNLDEYPGLELLQEGDSMSVEGEIIGVDRSCVELANVKVSF